MAPPPRIDPFAVSSGLMSHENNDDPFAPVSRRPVAGLDSSTTKHKAQAHQNGPGPSTLQEVTEFERAWSNRNGQALADMPVGTVVAVNMADGSYVTASDGLTAMDLFEERFGTEAIAWVHEVGVPISIGGGLWALSSGA